MKSTLAVINILEGRNLLTTLDTSPKARYWTKIVIFHTTPTFDDPVRGSPSHCYYNIWYRKTTMVDLPSGEKSLRLYVYSFWQVYERDKHRTDGQTPYDSKTAHGTWL